MVSSFLVDALATPDRELTALHDAHDAHNFPARVAAHFDSIFNTQNAFNQIPTLGLRDPPESHRDRAIVRFRAMVQDTSPSPEMYLARRADGRCAGWGLDVDASDPIKYEDLKECTVLWAVTIPGETSWCASEMDGGPHSTPSTPHLSQHAHKFPSPDKAHIGVQVKIYDNQLFKSTDVVTFVGILTSEPLHADLELPSPSLVPTLHVLFSRLLPSTIIDWGLLPASSSAKDLREELITWIADEALGSDREAAEWILLCAIGRVQSRTPPILPPSLTLSHFPCPPSQEAPTLCHVLGLLVPILYPIPLSLNVINTTAFAPESKDEDLHSGWLQIPSGSTCLMTEAGVTEGRIGDRGIANLRAIQDVISSQTLEYTFPYSRFSFNTEVSFLILCEGRKSAFFQTTLNMPLQPVLSHNLYKPDSEISLPSQEKLSMFRRLLGGARVGQVNISEATAEHIQEDFVKERKLKPEGDEVITADDLIHRMMVARLLALSLHETEVTVDIWEKTKILENKRRARVSRIHV